MLLKDIRREIPEELFAVLEKEGIKKLTPCQEKSIEAGLFKRKNLLVCTPTASGKTLVAELAMLKEILEHRKKAIYIVPLKALANEKYDLFTHRYAHLCKIALSVGNLDSADPYLDKYDLIVCTAEKFDSLIRHHAPWLRKIGVAVIDEIHLLNDVERGPTLEILITILQRLLPKLHLIALSATIGNPKKLASWLKAELILDEWRPVKLKKGVFYNNRIIFP